MTINMETARQKMSQIIQSDNEHYEVSKKIAEVCLEYKLHAIPQTRVTIIHEDNEYRMAISQGNNGITASVNLEKYPRVAHDLNVNNANTCDYLSNLTILWLRTAQS